jgi:hypothetical protein
LSQEGPEGAGTWSGKANGNEPRKGKKAQQCEKDVILAERTQCFGANKGLKSRRLLKKNAFLMPNELKFKPKRSQIPAFVCALSAVYRPKKRQLASLTGG